MVSPSKAAIAAICLSVGCLGVSAQDIAALQDASRLNQAAYRHSDGGAERALERGAYCAVQGVLVRNHAALPAVDGGIGCLP